MTGGGLPTPSIVAASYQGPGDITTGAIAFYSCGRAYNLAYAQALGAACDVVDTATGLVTGTMHFLATGFVNTTELTGVGQACHVACSITKEYDQTGTGNDAVQATLANMPALTFNAQNGLPCAAGTNNAAINLETAGAITQAAPFSETSVVERTGSFTTTQKISSNDTNVAGMNFTTSANTINSGIGGTARSLTANDNAFHALLSVASGTAPLFAINSSANTTTSSSGTTGISSNQYLMGRNGGTQGLLAGFVCEFGIWPTDLNSSYQAMLANMRSATNGWSF